MPSHGGGGGGSGRGDDSNHDTSNDPSSFLWGLNHHFPSNNNNNNIQNNSTNNPYADNSAAIASLNLIQQPPSAVDPFHQIDVFGTPSNSDFGTPSNLQGQQTGATPDSAAAQTFADQLALWTNANFSFDGPTGHALLGDDEDKDKPNGDVPDDEDISIPDAASRDHHHLRNGLGGAAASASASNSRQPSVAPNDARGRSRAQRHHQGGDGHARDLSRDRAARIGEPTHQSHKDQAVAAQQQHYFAPPNDADEPRRPGKLAAGPGPGGAGAGAVGAGRDRSVPNRTESSSRGGDGERSVSAARPNDGGSGSRQNSIPNFAPGFNPAAAAGAGAGGLDVTSALALQHLLTSAAGNPAFALAGLGAPHFGQLNGANAYGISSPPATGNVNASNATPTAFGPFGAAQNIWGALNPQQIQATLAMYLTAQAQAQAQAQPQASAPAAAVTTHVAPTDHPLDPFANGGSAPEVAFPRSSAFNPALHAHRQSIDVGDGGIGSGGLSAAGSSVAGDDEGVDHQQHTTSQQKSKKARTSSIARSGSISAAPATKTECTVGVQQPESPNTMAARLERLEDDIPPLKLIDTGNPEADAEANRLAIEEDKRRRNTAASARFRIKKKQREAALEQSLRDLRTRQEALEEENAALRTENGWLKSLITVRGVNGAGSKIAGAGTGAGVQKEDGAPDGSSSGGANGNGTGFNVEHLPSSSSSKGTVGAFGRDTGLHPRGVGTLPITTTGGDAATAAANASASANAARGFMNAAAIYGSQRAAAENKKRDRED